jgi:geranylgeranyl pyrophosphate synthase
VLSLAQALGQDGLAGGQMMDLYPPARPTEQDVFACQLRKTSALMRFAVEAGAKLGDCNAVELERLLRFAEDLGLLFQIRDDMLDRIGNAQVVGKALDKDEAAGRASATALLGLEGAANRSGLLETACQEALSGFGPKAMPLRNLVRFAVSRMH